MAAPITFAGLASGIDSTSLINSLITQERQTREQPLQDQISTLTDVNSSLDQLSAKLTALQSAAAKFRLVNGGALAKNGASSNEAVVSVATSNAAVNGS
jgi:flagellar capping protein FliD